MTRALLVVMVVGGALTAAAQTKGKQPRTLAGVCRTTNWVCVAECIDAGCVEQCLREGCEEALERLQICTTRAGCAPDDPECSARACGRTCERAFEPASVSPEKANEAPCQGLTLEGGGRVPEEVVGRWELSAATLKPEPKGTPTELEPEPRADYARTLEVTPEGCFVMRTELEDATLGQGNVLDVRAWGTFAVAGEERVVLRTQDGQAVGAVCGKPRVISLSKGKFRGPSYTFTVEGDTLTLVAEDPSKRTFQFQRQMP